ncbi:hypothetical protein SCMU_37870 [Sinomonas cyclohexanicum]|uniref:Plasmid pRiA4b Orf3-like domain-containing protein n=1 Tax=Sinomonas cyclohexanicum TaxID=322009 RepID=A0ABN6FMN9_SINCY|nr:plasmid pRiA4b ORF-3 family protein [Corynebacterium cyclohexanicum]BCT77945.1 hypothetical protein SCMU_37870 [Corynebacterium cyclohexanicum]
MAHHDDRPVPVRLRATLEWTEPPIWRVLDVDPVLTLDRLHRVLQIVFGWRDQHLHDFTDVDPYAQIGAAHGGKDPSQIREPRVWTDLETLDGGPPMTEEAGVRFVDALGSTGVLFYQYDFGDSWTVRLDPLEETGTLEPGAAARVDDGALAGPIDDSGGTSGYAQKLEILAGPDSEERRDLADWVEWVCGPWRELSPERFDVPATNRVLARLARAAPGHDGGAPPSAPVLAGIAGRLAEGMRPEFWAFVDAAGIEDGPITASEAEIGHMMGPYLWLIRRVGTDGLSLTDAGWLPPAVVREAADVLNLKENWIGSATRENSTPPILALRESAQWLGLVRKIKGRLTVPRAVQKLADDPRELWEHVAREALRRTKDGPYRDAAVLVFLDIAAGLRAQWRDTLEAVAFGLGALGWAMPDGEPLNRWDASDLTGELDGVLRSVGINSIASERNFVRASGAAAFARAALPAGDPQETPPRT